MLLGVLAYGIFGLKVLFKLDEALAKADRADTAYQYSQVVRALYRAAVACYEGRLGEDEVAEIEHRLRLATKSASFPELSPESRRVLLELEKNLPEISSCAEFAAWAERVFPVQVEATSRSNWIRAEIKAQIRDYKKSLFVGMLLLFLATGLVLFLLEQLRKAQAERIKKLEGEAEFRSRLLGLVAHELKTPLAAVAGFAELAANAGDEGARLRHLAGLKAASQRVRQALATFLDLHRLESQKSAERRPADLGELAEEALVVARGAFPQVEFSAELLKGASAPVERELVVHALINLLENAAKYGDGRVRLRLLPVSGGYRFEVASRGEVPVGEAEELFRPFSRLPEHRSREGWGLGLALVAEVARVHGGRVGVFRRGEETVFYLELPSAAR